MPVRRNWPLAAAMFGVLYHSATGTRCRLPDGSEAEIFVALKPPDSYSLDYLAGSFNGTLQISRSSLQQPDNPVMKSLTALWQPESPQNLQYLGVSLPPNTTSDINHFFHRTSQRTQRRRCKRLQH